MHADPRSHVDAPVRRALVWVMARGIALVATMAAVSVVSLAIRPGVQEGIAIGVVALAVLYLYTIGANLRARIFGRQSEAARGRAWDRARQVDADDAALGQLVAGWVPVGLLLAIGVLVWPQLTNPNPAISMGWLVLGGPPFVVGWLCVTKTWFEACRDDLARAEVEADSRLRTYWSNVRG